MPRSGHIFQNFVLFQFVFYNFLIVICHLFSLTSTSVIICVCWWCNVLFSCEKYGFNVIGRYDISQVLFTTAGVVDGAVACCTTDTARAAVLSGWMRLSVQARKHPLPIADITPGAPTTANTEKMFQYPVLNFSLRRHHCPITVRTVTLLGCVVQW